MRFFCLTILFLILAVSALAQTPAHEKNIVKSNKPNVYIDFERYSFYESPCGEPAAPGIWLRLHNNTKWPIYVDGQSAAEFPRKDTFVELADGSGGRGVKDGARIVMRYDFEGVPRTETRKEGNAIILFAPVEVETPKQSKYCSQKWMGRGRGRGLWIRSGESAIFSIPKLPFNNDLFVSIEYNYEWEAREGRVDRDQPHHSVRFYGSSLPSGTDDDHDDPTKDKKD